MSCAALFCVVAIVVMPGRANGVLFGVFCRSRKKRGKKKKKEKKKFLFVRHSFTCCDHFGWGCYSLFVFFLKKKVFF
jgi:hypothetical protein